MKIIWDEKNCQKKISSEKNQLVVCVKHGHISGLHSQPLPLGLNQHNRRIKLPE